jgi:hypothetical protein
MAGLRLGVILALLAFSISARQSVDQRPDRGGRVDAREALKEALIVKVYDQMASLTYGERAQFYSAQQPDVQIALWEHHLDEFQRLNPHLTETQREVIAAFIPLLLDVDRSVRIGQEGWEKRLEKVHSFESRARLVFAPDDYVRTFMRLGPPYIAVVGKPNVPDVGTHQCSCSVESDYCIYLQMHCVMGSDINQCVPTVGCGTGWLYVCDGDCF